MFRWIRVRVGKRGRRTGMTIKYAHIFNAYSVLVEIEFFATLVTHMVYSDVDEK